MTSRIRKTRNLLGIFIIALSVFIYFSTEKREGQNNLPIERGDPNALSESTNLVVKNISSETKTVMRAAKGYGYYGQILRLVDAVIDSEELDNKRTNNWHAEASVIKYSKAGNLIELEMAENDSEESRPLVTYGNEYIRADKITIKVTDSFVLETLEAVGNVMWRSFENCREAMGEKLTINHSDNSFRLEGLGEKTTISTIKGCEINNQKEV